MNILFRTSKTLPKLGSPFSENVFFESNFDRATLQKNNKCAFRSETNRIYLVYDKKIIYMIKCIRLEGPNHAFTVSIECFTK